jgi:hypothetical protein
MDNMPVFNKLSKISIIAFNPQLIFCKSKYLFVISHMRSRSSVLAHVLGSNKDIRGYSELHLSYRNQFDLLNLRVSLYKDLRCDLRNKYVLDKILHNKHIVLKKIIESTDVKILFLIRNANNTIKSMIKLGHKKGNSWYTDSKKAMDYYCGRLKNISELAKRIEGTYSFIDSNELVTNTGDILQKLSRWLKLSEPLSNRFSIFKNTGKASYGDSSPYIKAGKILKTDDNLSIKIPSDILSRGEAAYEECNNILRKFQ